MSHCHIGPVRTLAIFTVMVVAGVFGGLVNTALVKTDADGWKKKWYPYIAGIGAALLVPLFLKTVSSDLLANLYNANGANLYVDFFLFGGFCLIAAISSRAFIQKVSDTILKQIEHVSQEVQQAKAKTDHVEHEVQQTKAKTEHVEKAVGNAENRTEKLMSDMAALATSTIPTRRVIQEGDFEAAGNALREVKIEDLMGDPHAGKFGGRSRANGRKLEAQIRPLEYQPDLFAIRLTVTSDEKAARPLEGIVKFYLHPTFPSSVREVVADAGKAELNIIAWGAFTVGVEADAGTTRLELNLADHPDAIEPFKSR